MSQNDNRDTDPREDGVALSPYDDDLAPATEPPPPAPEPEFSDAPEDTAADVPAEAPAAPRPVAWQQVREPAQAAEDTQEGDDAPAGVQEPFDSEYPDDAAFDDVPHQDAVDGPIEQDEDAGESLEQTAAWEPVSEGGSHAYDPEVDGDLQAEVAADSLADETLDEDVQTSTYEVPDPVSDTAIRRTSLLRPAEDAEEEELVPAVAPIPEDDRASAYGPEDSDLFAGATYDKVPSRAGAHAWSLITILLAPIAWYLLSDAGARMTLPDGAAWQVGTVNLAAVGELAAGLVVAFIVMLAARASSLGVFVTGALLAIVGGAFVVAPAWTKDLIEPLQSWLRRFNPDFGGNIAHHLEWDGATGRIFIAGIGLILVAMVSHFARRRGRDEEKIRNAIAQRRPRD